VAAVRAVFEQLAAKSLRLLRSFVHFPVSGNNLVFHIHSFLSSRQATPGKVLPSKNSRLAPPPLLTCVILSLSPDKETADTLSPPPTMLVAPLSATARATANVPAA